MLADLKMFGRYARGLARYLRQPLTPDQCREKILQQLANREESFLQILQRGIYAQPQSPYRKLLENARIACEDVVQLVRQKGLPSALETIHNAGVYVTLDEFKCRQPIRRGRLELSVKPSDFDNPLLARHYEARTGATRGAGTRLIVDFDLLAHEAAYVQHFLKSFDLTHRPIVSWRPVPLATSGMKLLLRYAKLGKPVAKWFAQNRLEFTAADWKYFVFTHYTLAASRLCATPMPYPEFTPTTDSACVAQWLAATKAAGAPAVLDTNASSGVRVCQAAQEHGLDIAGTFLRLGGEPYTPAKAQIVSAAGCRAACHYSISEIGIVAMACGDPADLDDVHLLEDKVAAIQRPQTVDRSGAKVQALVYTTLLPSCPKLMLNVESGDYAISERRACGCPFGALGMTQHLQQIRSYEKLCSEGITFLGTELLRLVEEVLPACFGGDFTDYQLVETEEHGLPQVCILVSPRRGSIDETQLLTTVLQLLRSYPGGQIMAQQWQEAQTLRVLRREPYSTGSAKIMPLHILPGSRVET